MSHGPSGVLALNKQAGMTSFQAVREVRRIFHERRVGHAGTLDPTATGVLPICIGNATRVVDYFHGQKKTYHCIVHLGVRSDTLDTEGTIIPVADASAITREAVVAALHQFQGEIEQIPPMFSAVRVDGKHLYDLARAGEVIERSPRQVTIYDVELHDFTPGEVARAELTVVSGKGAYMRTLAADLGEALGVGGLLAWLERTVYGPLCLDDTVTLETLATLPDPTTVLLPPSLAVDHLPRVDLVPQLATRIGQGQSVFIPSVTPPRPQGLCRAHDPEGHLLALGELRGNLLRPTKVLLP